MERIAAQDARIALLGALLERPTREAPAPEVVPEDPRVALEAERIVVLAQAREAGHAEGMALAEAAIARAVAAAEARVREEHARESERLRTSNAQMTALLAGVPDALDTARAQLQDNLVEIAFDAVLRVIGATQRPLVAAACERALEECLQRPATLRINAADHAALASIAAEAGVAIDLDPRVPEGELRVCTQLGEYTTGVEHRLRALLDVFLRAQGGDAR